MISQYSFLQEAGNFSQYVNKKNAALLGSSVGGTLGGIKSLATSKSKYEKELRSLKQQIKLEKDPYKKDELIQRYHQLKSKGYGSYATKDFVKNAGIGAAIGTGLSAVGHDIYKTKNGLKYTKGLDGKIKDTTFSGAIKKGIHTGKKWIKGKIIGPQEKKAFNTLQQIKIRVKNANDAELQVIADKLAPFSIAVTGKNVTLNNAKVTKQYLLKIISDQQKSILDTAHKTRGELNKLLVATGLLPPIATLGVSIGVSKHYDNKSKIRRYSDNIKLN